MNEYIKGASILLLTCALGLGGYYLWESSHKVLPSPIATPHPIQTEMPTIAINKPNDVLTQVIAKGEVTKEAGNIVIKGNDKPITFIVPPVSVKSKDNSVVVTPGLGNQVGTKTVIVPEGGGTIQLPEQNWNIKIDREYSPFRVDLFALPEPAIGLGYDLVTVSLDKPLGVNLNLGNISAGPVVAKSMMNENFYAGAELSKSLGRVNANVGYAWQVNTGNGKVLAGVSFNFR